MRQELQQSVELAPEQRLRLEALLANYLALETDADLINDLLDTEKQKLFELLDDEGVKDAIQMEGRTLKIVRGESSRLDKQKFVALGGNLEHLQLATIRKPKKAYLDIRKAGEKRRGDVEEEAA